MTGDTPVPTLTGAELIDIGRKQLAAKKYTTSVETLKKGCDALAEKHGNTGDQCAEAYYWYGKALIELSRKERGVGYRLPGDLNQEVEEELEFLESDESYDDDSENSNQAEDGEEEELSDEEDKSEEIEGGAVGYSPGENEEANDESAVNLEKDKVEHLELAWESLELARTIVQRRLEPVGKVAGAGEEETGEEEAGEKAGGAETAGAAPAGAAGPDVTAMLADVYLALGEAAMESDSFDKAVADMQRCLALQKALYGVDDQRLAETHFKLGLAYSMALKFEEALTHFQNSVHIIVMCINNIKNEENAPFEIQDLLDMLPEAQLKIDDLIENQVEAALRER